MPHLLTISGSLRHGSSNSALLAAAAHLTAPDVFATPYTNLAALPAFNPDVEDGSDPVPDAVTHWRSALASADAVLISSPEYAHGVPGVLKNALDWVVGSGELVSKPVGLLSASAASAYVHPQLLEILAVMSADLVSGACMVVDIPRRGVDAMGLMANTEVAAVLKQAVEALMQVATTRASHRDRSIG